MDKNSSSTIDTWKPVLFFGLLFLLFFQLVSDFIETVYAFGLLGTDIPPEIVSVLLFFTPLILLLFRRGLPYRVTLALAGIAALAHPLEVMLDPKGKMLVSGLGSGLPVRVILPVLLAHRTPRRKEGRELGSGLALGLALSILLRSLGAGSDLSLLQPWLSWLFAIGLLVIVLWQALSAGACPDRTNQASCLLWRHTALCIGIIGTLAVLYFAFTSPTVLARWTDLDYRLVVFVLSLALALYAIAVFWQPFELAFQTAGAAVEWAFPAGGHSRDSVQPGQLPRRQQRLSG